MKYHNFCTCNDIVVHVLLSITNYRRNPLDICIEKKTNKKINNVNVVIDNINNNCINI